MSEREPIDPALRHFLDEQAASAGPAVAMSDQERTAMARARLVKALQSRTAIPGLPNQVHTRDLAITADLTGRLYTPRAAVGPLPILVYFHGGGWAAGSIATHDPFCRLLCEAANLLIVSIEYRLSPEHPHPAAFEDALTAVHWTRDNAAQYGGDPTRLAVGGDSAGGHLAAITANRLCAQGQPLAAQLLLFPVTDHPSANHLSWSDNATGYGLEATLMRWFWDQYAPAMAPNDTDLSPLRLPTVPSLPPTLVATAEYDVLRDEGIAYAEKLRAAGVAVTHLHAPDMHHNFAVHPATVERFPQSQATLTKIAAWLAANLSR
jgi:acetyl esterase